MGGGDGLCKRKGGVPSWVVSASTVSCLSPLFFDTKCLEGKSYSIDAVYDLHGR